MAYQPDLGPLPTKALDIWVVTLIAVGGAAMVVGNIVILCNRTYRPVKSKSVPLTLLSSLGGLFWITAVLVTNDHFERRKHSGLDICILWTYWLQTFGFALWLNCLTLRLIVLYRIFICKKDARTCYPFLAILLLPAVVFCIVASFLDQLKYYSRTAAPSSSPGKVGEADCRFEHNASMAYTLIALLVFYSLAFFWLAFKLRNVMEQFNEFRLIRRGGILSLFLFLISLVTIQTHAYYRPVGRCLLSAAVASAIFYYFWDRNGGVVYNVIFNREDYLDKFEKDLKRTPSQHEREIFSSGSLQMEAQLRNVRAEVEKYQQKIRQLEEELKALELGCVAMQQVTSPHLSPGAHENLTKDYC